MFYFLSNLLILCLPLKVNVLYLGGRQFVLLNLFRTCFILFHYQNVMFLCADFTVKDNNCKQSSFLKNCWDWNIVPCNMSLDSPYRFHNFNSQGLFFFLSLRTYVIGPWLPTTRTYGHLCSNITSLYTPTNVRNRRVLVYWLSVYIERKDDIA